MLSRCRVLFLCAVFCIQLPGVYRVQAVNIDIEEGETEVTQVYQQLEDVLQGPEQDVQSTANDSFHQDGDIAISSGHGQEIGLHLWLNKTVYYTYAETLSYPSRETFKAALNEWSSHTCIQFKLAERGQDHILFVRDDQFGCSSHVGKKGGVQIVSMTDSCFSKGEAMRLIGHAIGLWPEHSRPDRDSFIKVLYENINETELDNFEKLPRDKSELVPDVGYDIESITHFGPYKFSTNNKMTIRIRDDAPLKYKHCTNLLTMGQRNELSYLDKLRTNKLYSCQEHVNELESVGRDCILPPTTPTPSTTPTPLTTPLPTSAAPLTKCPFASSPTLSPILSPMRIKSGNTIILQFANKSKGVRCSPRCRPKSCLSQSTCHETTYQFDIVAIDRNVNKIKSGSKVALRSKCNPAKWLDCSSGSDYNCSIRRCNRCMGDICSYNDNDKPCDYHHFKVFGVGRRDERLLTSTHKVYFRQVKTNSLLTCVDDVCKLSIGEPSEHEGQMFSITNFS